MKKTWKTLGMAVLSIGILAGCGSQVAQTESGATIIEEGKLTFAVSGEFKPFSYMDENK